jgi:MOSC domain-containing protein YiiM
MSHNTITNGLLALGFKSGWVVTGDEITLWENTEPQPTLEAILEAAKDYVEPEPTIDDKLASVGLSLSDLKTALGL